MLSGVRRAAESQRCGPVLGRRHQQKFAVLIATVGLREVPIGSLRPVVAAAPQYRGPGTLVRFRERERWGILNDVLHPRYGLVVSPQILRHKCARRFDEFVNGMSLLEHVEDVVHRTHP